ncbi:MAG: peptide chain release factor N(5)-glutamine methyltransferase [bacterium]
MNLKNNYSNNTNEEIDKDLSVYKLIKWGETCLKDKNIQNPFNESAGILKHVLKKTLDEVIISYNDKTTENKINLFKRLIERRARKEPFAYIVNKKEFYSLDFFVSRSVLIPRPDTECLVDESLKEIKRLAGGLKRKIYVLDIGTGSGAIAISIAKNSDNVIIYAADNSIRSLNAARKNIIANGVQEKVIPVYFDMLKLKSNMPVYNPDYNANIRDFNINDFDNFDIIVSNPPYIKTDELKTLDGDIKLYEPLKALDGGKDGLKFYRKIFDNAALQTKKKKTLILEIDYREKSAMRSLFNEKFENENIKFKNIAFINDLNNKERAVKIIYG